MSVALTSASASQLFTVLVVRPPLLPAKQVLPSVSVVVIFFAKVSLTLSLSSIKTLSLLSTKPLSS